MKDVEYSMTSNSVLVVDRVVVPQSLRVEVMVALHHSNSGVRTMQARTREALFWPGMGKDIERTCKECKMCLTIAPSQLASPA